MKAGAAILLFLTFGSMAQGWAQPKSRAFRNPRRVTIQGYQGDAMEPFLTRDGRYLLFNNSNDPAVDTNLQYAERIDDLRFVYKGEIDGVNTPALEGVPTIDRNGTLYFVSTRSYAVTLSTLFRGRFDRGRVSTVRRRRRGRARRPTTSGTARARTAGPEA
jgi:hypothetical protein